jgi:uncharacterized phosphatase
MVQEPDMKHLYICRHGESELNILQCYAGRTNTPLTDRGRAQARQAGAHAVKLKLDYIVCSTLSRALETAQIIAHEIGLADDKILANELFVEKSYGELEGKSYDIIADPAVYTGIESEADLRTRALQALDFLHQLPVERILVVSHGSFLDALRHAMKLDNADKQLLNAQIVELI